MGAPSYLPDYEDAAASLFPAHGSLEAPAVSGPSSAPAPSGLAFATDDSTPNHSTPNHSTPDHSHSGRATVRPPAASIVRLRVPTSDGATRQMLQALGQRQVAFASSLAWTHARVAGLPRDPSTRAAAVSLLARLADLGDVRDALNELYCAVARRAGIVLTSGDAQEGLEEGEERLLTPGSPLAMYLEGVYAWLLGSADALSIVGDELLRMESDWWILRLRLGEAKANYPEALAPAVRSALWALPDEAARTDLTWAFDELSFALRVLEANLTLRFG